MLSSVGVSSFQHYAPCPGVQSSAKVPFPIYSLPVENWNWKKNHESTENYQIKILHQELESFANPEIS